MLDDKETLLLRREIAGLLQKIVDLKARVAELEAALTLIADEQNVYKGYGDYDIVPRYTAEEAQALARRVLSGIKEGDA